jgi:ubiquitin carboxyl-terminal hydrolase 1
MLATHKRLLSEIRALEEATRPEAKPSVSKKRRLKDACKMERQVKTALEEGRIEDDLQNGQGVQHCFLQASNDRSSASPSAPII